MTFFQNFEETNSYLAEQVKVFMFKNDNNIFNKLDFDNDSIFLDPFFFACINNKGLAKDYLNALIGCYSDTSSFSLKTNSLGELYLPTLGTFLFNHPNEPVVVEKEKSNLRFKNTKGLSITPLRKEIRKNKYGIEYMYHNNPIIQSQFQDNNVVILDDTRNEDFSAAALEVIKDTYPEFFNLITKAIKKVVFYEGRDNSFASMQTHGIIYLNVKKEYNEIFFLDNILHQSAHVIFNTLTLKTKKELFQFPHTAPFSHFIDDKSRTEDVYGRFHGLFTQSNINTCLRECYKRKTFSGLKEKELIGRLTSNLTRFASSIENFNKPALYKEEGLKWYTYFRKKYESLYNDTEHLITKYKVDNQPYVFDFNIFYDTNFGPTSA